MRSSKAFSLSVTSSSADVDDFFNKSQKISAFDDLRAKRVIGVDDYRLASGLAVSMWGFSALPEVPDPISCGIARPSFDLTRAKHQVSIPLG